MRQNGLFLRQMKFSLSRMKHRISKNKKKKKRRVGRREMFHLMSIQLYGLICERTAQRKRKTAAVTSWVTISSYQQDFFYMNHPTDRIEHTTAFVTPVVNYWLERRKKKLSGSTTRDRSIASRTDAAYHGLCYTSRELLAGKKKK